MATDDAMREETVESLLYDAIVELSYIACVEVEGDHSMCATSRGAEIVERGMKLLKVKDLSEEHWQDAVAAGKVGENGD